MIPSRTVPLSPLGTRVLLRRPPITAKIGLIEIPDKYRSVPQEGTVVAIGPGVSTVKVGDVVLHGRHNFVEVPGAPDLRLVWERDLMAILDAHGGACPACGALPGAEHNYICSSLPP